jgi:hypothetical protein
MKWAVFDLEFTELLPEASEVPWAPDVHIACAAVMTTEAQWPQVWHEAGPAAHSMSQSTLKAFVEHLEALVDKGHNIVTWGGSASDWRMLAKELRDVPHMDRRIRTLALNSYDVPMCSAMAIGMMMGLQAASAALGLALKTDSSSATVPSLWACRETRPKVLQHVSNDAYATMLVLCAALQTCQLHWVTQKGHLKTWHAVELIPVRECLKRELPSVPFPIGPSHNPKILARWLLLESSQ